MENKVVNFTDLSTQEREVLKYLLEEEGLELADEQVIRPTEHSDTAPLSFAQQRLWFLDQLEPGSPFYNLPRAIRLEGPLDVAALKLSLSETIRRHEILRTSFDTIDGEPVQVISSPGPLNLPVIDLTGLPNQARNEEAARLASEAARLPFDLRTAPLVRAALVKIDEQEHIALFTMHHIISDAWSAGIFVGEVADLYEAFSAGKPSPLAHPAIQYADFARWQHDFLEGEVLQKQLSYWKAQLAGNPPVLELPLDRSRPAIQTFRGAMQPLQLPRSLTHSLRKLNREGGTTLFMSLLATFKALLYRYTGVGDIVIGLPTANRNRPELEQMIGFFANTLVLRTDLSDNPTFRQLLNRVRDVVLEAHNHQDLPFERLVDELQPERHLSHNPLFEIMFVHNNTPTATRGLPGIKMSLLNGNNDVAKFDFIVFIQEAIDGLAGSVIYNTDLFDASTVARMVDHFQSLLEGAAANPDVRISDLPMLTTAERQQLSVWNSTFRSYPAVESIHQLFEQQVEKTPSQAAIVFEEEQLSYEQLNENANRLAHWLGDLGVGAEDLVGVCMERSPEMVIALLAVLKAGAAYVPIDPAYPRQRLALMLEDANVKALLTQQHLESILPDIEAEVVRVDRHQIESSNYCHSNPLSSAQPGNLAYVIYTSGSTGVPKGVMNTHQGICNRLLWMQDAYRLTESDRVLQKTPFSFDVSVWEFFWPLMTGACLVLAEPEGHRDCAYLVKLITAQHITTVHFVPSMLQMFLEDPGVEHCTSLKRVICSGEALSFAVQQRFFERLRAELHNLYGPTEAAVDVTSWRCDPDSKQPIVPIGQPIANTQIYLLDGNLQVVPIGVSGELHIGGVGLARGYLNRPELTAEKFIPNPFSQRPNGRLYKTGDLACYLPDGNIRFLNRIDYQVKIRGFRIELGEIEAAVREHPGVEDVAVVTTDSAAGGKSLVAYLIPDRHRAFAVRQLLRLDNEGSLTLRQRYELPNGLMVIHLNKSETDFTYKEIFEEQAYLRGGITIDDGDCVFDVGANIGLFTLFIGQRCKNLDIYAFEPLPPIFEVLRINTSLYGLNAKLFNRGLSNESGNATFTYYPHVSIFSGRFADAQQEKEAVKAFLLNNQVHKGSLPDQDGLDELLADRLESTPFECRMMTISDVIRENELKRIDLLKIDVEKSEFDVLSGIEEEDWEKIKQIIVEVHDFDGRLDRIARLLTRYGYNLTIEQEAQLKNTGLHSVYASRLPKDRNVPAEAARWATPDSATTWNSPGRLISDVRGFLQRKLPEYMIPSHFLELDVLPLTPNGKVDLRALPAFDVPRPDSSVVAEEVLTPVEEVVAQIWTDVLGLASVGIHDNFFDLGGHSLLATKVRSRLRDSFKVDLALRTIFEAPTVAGLAQHIEIAIREEQRLPLSPIVPVSRDLPLPLSFSQERLWFLSKFDPENAVYNVHNAIQLKGRLDVVTLERTLTEVTRRHEVLRTSIVTVDGQWVQIINPVQPFNLPVVDLSELPVDHQQTIAVSIASEEAQRPFGIECDSLLRAFVLRLGEDNHIVLLTIHHAIVDEWSMGLLVREVATLYDAFSKGLPSPLPELAIQYADFAYWQHQWLQGDVLEKQYSYWKRWLDGDLPTLSLPADRPRPAVQTFRGTTASRLISSDLSQAVKRLGKQEGATFFMTLLAAFEVLLYRYSNQEDIIVGTPIAGRNWTEVEGLIGLFINTLVLRTDLSGDPSFAELLSRVREAALGAYAHQDMPFEELVRELQPQRNLNRSPLFQVTFDLQNAAKQTASQTIELPGLSWNSIPAESKTAKFDLSLQISEVSQGLIASLQYSTDLFNASTIQRMLCHFERLLEAVVADAHRPISGLSMLTEPELHQLLIEFNDTEAPYPADACVHELFEQQVEKTPNQIGVTFDGRHLTFAQLNARANQLAHHLRTLGVGPDTRVPICLERSLESAVGLLAILKAGGAYAPLDPELPRQRLAFLMEDLSAGIALSQRRLAHLLADTPANVICIDLDGEVFAGHSLENPDSGVGSNNAAYIIYTSGSTGLPKGVIIEHKGMLNHLCVKVSGLKLTDADVVAQTASLFFDISVWQFFAALLAGGRIHILSDEVVRDPLRLLEQVSAGRITILEAVPSLLRMMVDEAERHPIDLSALRWLIPTGEELPPELCTRWLNIYPGVPLLNAYGPTECSDDVTHHPIYEAPSVEVRHMPIGRAIENTRLYILGRGLNPVPVGVAGELYVGGVGVGRGYLNEQRRTAEVFLPDPFAEEPGSRLYKTGDQVRYLPDGNIEFLGRVDHQVKIRGFRIELGEIEATLRQHQGIETAVVQPKDINDDKHLVAYVVARQGKAPTLVELRGYLKERLPDYMLPSAMVLLDELPLTPNGKVNRKALPTPDIDRFGSGTDYIEPRTPIEDMLANIWTEVLGVKNVGINDDFFDLGGHSLLATQVLSRISNSFQVDIPLRAIFEAPTVTELGAVISQAMLEHQGVQLPAIKPVSRDGHLPLSFAQQRLWFIHLLAPDSAAYNLLGVHRIAGEVDETALVSSLYEMGRRHEALRTTFEVINGEPAQLISPIPSLPLQTVDLQELDDSEREAELHRLIKQQGEMPFDLTQGVAWRVTVVKSGAQQHTVALTMHHIISDGWSMNIFNSELIRLYEAFRGGRISPLEELQVQYADYAVWQREWMQGEVLEKELNYWEEKLAGAAKVIDLPADRPRPPVQTFRGKKEPITLDGELTSALQKLSRQEGVTLFMTLVAALNVLLYRYSNQEDIIISTGTSSRNRKEMEGIIGCLINIVLLRTDLTGEPSFKDVMRQVRGVSLEAYAHQDTPFEMIVRRLDPERDLSRQPMFQVMIVMLNLPEGAGEQASLGISAIEEEKEVAQCDLMLHVRKTGDGIAGRMTYNTDVFEAETVRQMLGHLKNILESAVRNPGERISAMQMLGDGETNQVIHQWNDTRSNLGEAKCLHRLFEHNVERTPEATALVSGRQRISYAELNKRANRLASYLRREGVGPEERVGLSLGRGTEMVVAILGILKSGGAYVPIDPEYPIERIKLMLEDSRISVMVTEKKVTDRIGSDLVRRVVLIDEERENIRQQSKENIESGVTEDNLAYVIYTSGSTGRPKGVAIVHRGVVNNIRDLNDRYGIGKEDAVLAVSSLSFDMCVYEVLGTLAAGGKIVMAAGDGWRDPQKWIEMIEKEQVTVWNSAPALLEAMVDYAEDRGAKSLNGLKLALLGGDWAPVTLPDRLKALAEEVQVVVLGGATEASIHSVEFPVMESQAGRRTIPYGWPMRNQRCYVIDKRMQIAARGVAGELYLGGMGLGRGYYGDPEKTAEKFVPDWLSEDAGARLYRTGDLARYMRDGTIELLGRIDFQIKIRGHRIELGEIEAALREQPGIDEAVVVAQPDKSGSKHLVAYVVGKTDAPVVTDELKQALRAKLPEYMVPVIFMTLSGMPLSPNGKVDRRMLPSPDDVEHQSLENYVAARTPIEETLVEIWKGVLGTEEVSICDNFFNLGGHSLLAMQVVSRLRDNYQVNLALRSIFENPTIEQLAGAIEEALVQEIDHLSEDEAQVLLGLED